MLTHVYLAHPYGGEDLNLAKAEQAYAILSHMFPSHVFLANWIHHCRAFVDSDRDHRALGMARNFSEIERADEIWAVGFDSVSLSEGMEGEITFAANASKQVRSVTIRLAALAPSLKKAIVDLDPPLPGTHAEETEIC
jgi:aminopeptidase N